MADNQGRDTVVVDRGGSGGGMAMIAVVLLIAVIIGAYFLLNQSKNDNLRTNAVTQAAHDVGSSAKKAGDAVAGDSK